MMKEVLFGILKLIALTNACFTFKNSTKNKCIGNVTCWIGDPLLKIDEVNCQPNSFDYLRLLIKNIDDLESLFLNNTETVHRMMSVVCNDNLTRVFVFVANITLPSQRRFEINNQWLRDLFGPYKVFYSRFYLIFVAEYLPRIRINVTNLTEIVSLTSSLWLRFDSKNTSCVMVITTRGIIDRTKNCFEHNSGTATTRSKLYQFVV